MHSFPHYKLLAFFLFFTVTTYSQQRNSTPERLKVFVDCANTSCDMTYIKTEINIVDFLLDRLASDIHILITSQPNGNGSKQFQLIFYGQNKFNNYIDTLQYNLPVNNTPSEARDWLVQYIKIGLIPLLSKTGLASTFSIGMKTTDSSTKNQTTLPTKDPWNYWVFNTSLNGNINADKVYKEYRFNGNFTVSRVTDILNVSFSLYGSENKTTYSITNGATTQKYIARNRNFGFNHYLIRSINNHWSIGYQTVFGNNTFENYKSQLFVHTAIEYAIFPYRDVNNRFFTLSYGFIFRNNHYYDTTIYLKTKEALLAHQLEVNLNLNKKWGTLKTGLTYSNFLQQWKLNNMGAYLEVNIRITGGLSFYIYSDYAIVHDQVYIPKGGATEQEVLTRVRQLETNFTVHTGLGVNYRFGSKLNNFVNPRFKGRG